MIDLLYTVFVAYIFLCFFIVVAMQEGETREWCELFLIPLAIFIGVIALPFLIVKWILFKEAK